MSEEENILYLPSSKIDDHRIQFLFSPFRKRELNPDGWQAKMNFWVQVINQFSTTEKMAVLTANDVCAKFERNKKFPACIDDVLNYMYRQNSITTAEKYIYYHLPQTWFNWSYNVFIKYPMIQMWSSICDLFFLSSTSQRFVVSDVLKVMANEILTKYEELRSSENVDDVLVLEDFQKRCVDVCEGESFNFALMQLEHENKLKIFEEADGVKIIKFKANENHKFEISKIDQSILLLRRSMNQNIQMMDKISIEQKQCVANAQQFVKRGLKGRAMLWLKKGKRLQEDLLKRITTQDNLEVMLSKVRNCSSDKMILDAYNASVTAVKHYLTTDLVLSEVDETMDNVRECLDESNEVQERLAENLDADNDDLLDELEAELKELISTEIEVEKRAQMREIVKTSEHEFVDQIYEAQFPSIPCDDVGAIKSSQVVKKRVKEKEVAL